MILSVRILDGLPVYGEMAAAYPDSFAKTGQEGTVVEFETDERRWVGNFARGADGLDLAELHPNKCDAVVIAGGDLWVVNVETGTAEYLLPAVYSATPVKNPDGWVFSRQEIALARLGPDGLLWHTKRISWDGFDQVQFSDDKVMGLAWNPMGDAWEPFEVDLRSGESTGGSYSFDDGDGWEQLASPVA